MPGIEPGLLVSETRVMTITLHNQFFRCREFPNVHDESMIFYLYYTLFTTGPATSPLVPIRRIPYTLVPPSRTWEMFKSALSCICMAA